MNRIVQSALCALPLVVACSSEPTGQVVFTTWGEEFIEQQIPAEEFADGWSVTFSKFLVVLRDISVQSADEEGLVDSSVRVFDLTRPGKKSVTQAELPAREWPQVGFRIGPPGDDARVDASASDADLALLKQGGYSVYVEGRGERGGVSKTFAWGFSADTIYKNCRGEVGGSERFGALVTAGGTDTIELTMHGDHLFYDDLASASAKLRFDNIAAADANDDGVVTLEELDAVALEDLQGGSYQVGGFSDVFTYKDFVTRLSRTIGHFRGEGECEL